jgi:DNA-binding SARP family transcriptional activator
MTARVLGGFHVRVDGREIGPGSWERKHARHLVELLLITPGHRLLREVVVDLLWPERDREAGNAALRKALHFARRALGDPELLVADRDTVALAPTRLDLDLDVLRAALASADDDAGPGAGARQGDGSTLEYARTVGELGLLELLPDERYEDWATPTRNELWMASHRCALAAAHRLLEEGEHLDALALIDGVLAREPTDEAAHRLAIACYVADGRHDAALQQLEWCRAVLRQDLGVEPATETLKALGEAGAPG